MLPSDRRKRITIKDVAQKAGVSTRTVSRVMNKFSFVAGETRQRVEAVVEQLGYRPSLLACSLIQQRSYTLGIVTCDLKYIGRSRTLSVSPAGARHWMWQDWILQNSTVRKGTGRRPAERGR